MFSFQPCVLRWPYLRGGKALSTVLNKNSISYVSDVVVLPGHVALLLHSNSLLCLFDAVPGDRQLSELDQRNLANHLISNQKDDLASHPALLISLHSARLCRIWFENQQNYLHLFAAQEDGVLFCWIWLKEKYLWSNVGKTVLPPTRIDLPKSVPSLEKPPKRIVSHVTCSKKSIKGKQLLVWCESYRAPTPTKTTSTTGTSKA
jgi:hypothetical protein